MRDDGKARDRRAENRDQKSGKKPKDEGRSLRLDEGRWKSQRAETGRQRSDIRGRRSEVPG